MAIIKERVESLEANYTYEEIAFVYNKLRHNMSLGPGITKQVKEKNNKEFIEFISKKLAEKYTGSETVYKKFKEPAEDLYGFLEIMPANTSLNDLLENMPLCIESDCTKVAKKICE